MKAKRWMCYAVFYAVAICVVITVKANPGHGYWWAPPLLYALMSWPFFMWYYCGKFQFTPHYVEPIELRCDETQLPCIEVERPVRRRGPSSLELLRRAPMEHQRQPSPPEARTPKRVPAAQRPTTLPTPEMADKPMNGKRASVSKHSVPTVPTGLPGAAAAMTDHAEETTDAAKDYWQAKLHRQARHPDEFSLPLFPDEERALNANISSEDPFL